jgi:hypothetical protein
MAFIIGSLLLLGACQTTPLPGTVWAKPNGDTTTFRQNDYTCRQLATPTWGTMQAGPMRWRVYHRCMTEHGYTATPPFPETHWYEGNQ